MLVLEVFFFLVMHFVDPWITPAMRPRERTATYPTSCGAAHPHQSYITLFGQDLQYKDVLVKEKY